MSYSLEEYMRGLYFAVTIGLFFFMVLFAGQVAFGAQTATVTDTLVQANDVGSKGWTWQRQGVYTATAAGEQACMDVRGYTTCMAKVDISGTINVDLDWNITSTYDANFVVDEDADITADQLTNVVVDGLYLCYDMDACTTCTLTLTVVCVGDGVQP